MLGVVCTFGIGCPANVGCLDQSRFPTMLSTDSAFIVSATLALLLGSPLTLSTAVATSNSERVAPSCWFHCLPEAASYPSPSCLQVTPVSVDLYGQVGAQ